MMLVSEKGVEMLNAIISLREQALTVTCLVFVQLGLFADCGILEQLAEQILTLLLVLLMPAIQDKIVTN